MLFSKRDIEVMTMGIATYSRLDPRGNDRRAAEDGPEHVGRLVAGAFAGRQ